MGKNSKTPGFLESLTEFMSDEAGLSDEDISVELRALGIDPETLERKVQELVTNASTKRRLAWRETAKKRRDEIEKLLGEEQEALPSSLNLKSKIRRILEGGFGQGARSFAEAYFRKKDGVSERDLATLLEDLEHLNLLKQSDKDND